MVMMRPKGALSRTGWTPACNPSLLCAHLSQLGGRVAWLQNLLEDVLGFSGGALALSRSGASAVGGWAARPVSALSF